MSSVFSNRSSRIQVWQVLQEALDIYAAMHREAIATQHGNKEYLLWVLGSDGYQLTCVDTLDMGVGPTVVSPTAISITATPAWRCCRGRINQEN